MAANSKRSTPNETKFTEAEKNWNLEKLYEDLRAAKQKVLTNTEKCHLRGLLCGYSPKEIADERVIVVGTVNDALSKTLYGYIEDLLNREKKIRHWSHVPDFLEKAGYKIQVSEQSQSNHSLPNRKENTLEISHAIGAISFLEYFSKSIDQLKSKDLDVRIGAISTLETIAKYSQPAEHWTIMEYLAAFVRTNASRKEEGEEKRLLKLQEDIQAALTVIGRRNPDYDQGLLNLRNIDIRGANLFGAKLQGAYLNEANLRGVCLTTANLKGAVLWEANLEGAKLNTANLEEAKLCRTNLRKVNFSCSRLPLADLSEAKLPEADLSGTDLRKAYLYGANLERAYLYGANLQEASLRRANGQRADFRRAYFQGADLSEANFKRARNLTQSQIEIAQGDKNTTLLPENQNLTPPKHWTEIL